MHDRIPPPVAPPVKPHLGFVGRLEAVRWAIAFRETQLFDAVEAAASTRGLLTDQLLTRAFANGSARAPLLPTADGPDKRSPTDPSGNAPAQPPPLSWMARKPPTHNVGPAPDA